MPRDVLSSYGTSVGRWSGVGPYYAMFPLSFAFDTIRQFTREGESVLDPFAGRASSIYAAYALGRVGTGIEINPVGWLYGSVKMNPAAKVSAMAKLIKLANGAEAVHDKEIEALPEFFHACYCKRVLRFLLHARQTLDWKNSKTGATLMALILIDLHGKEGAALSNQMRQGKAMAPDYSVEWWMANKKVAPDIDPLSFMTKKMKWRYAKGVPRFRNESIILGDCVDKLRRLKSNRCRPAGGYNLLFTSPPYYGVTNYFNDQWLRLWMLGNTARPTMEGKGKWEKRFASAEGYRTLLADAFAASAPLLAPDATIYVRTDARRFTLDTTLEVLCDTFPEKQLERIIRPVEKPSQTALYGDKVAKPGEVDLVFRPRRQACN